jgi:eukaryotic-like serine/threonine-protein kinase
MSESRAARAAELLKSALEREPQERSAFLDETCGSDVDLRAEVESLLQFQQPARRFMQQPAVHLAADVFLDRELKAEETIGDYEIISLIGSGGMGDVYLAEDRQLHRQVALKIVRRGSNTEDVVRRFQREEQILASLNHPNIARLYGGAITSDGVPFFVMEYVDGTRLDEYCDENRLALKERLALFRKVCAAVAYAHQHLVIHRDLKPSNIRVTREGEPKLLDFGIAKLLDPATSVGSELTMTFPGAMTPEYASPEQVRGETMATTSDVYSLGVVLYRLLTDQTPYRTKTNRPDEIARAIIEQEPTRPSTVVTLNNQQSEISNQKLLRGDLDNIVLRALRKEPQRRYESAAQFSEDIRRHLEGLPVIARKDTFEYRSAKFIKRHRVGVTAAALVALALIGGTVATVWEARRVNQQRILAERRFDDVRQLANSLMFELHGAIENLPGATAARELLVKRALEYLAKLSREANDNPSLQQDLVSAYLKVGNVQGNPSYPNLGDPVGALQSYRQARRIADQLLTANPKETKALRSVAMIEEKMGDVQSIMGDVTGAVESVRRSLAGYKSLAEVDQTNVRAQQFLAISYVKMGDVLGNSNFPNSGDQAGAMKSYRSSWAILQSLDKANPNDGETRRYLGLIHERIGTMLEQEGRMAEALDSYRESQGIREELIASHPENADAARNAAVAHEKMGNVMTALGDLGGALESRTKSLEIFKRIAGDDPRDARAQQSLAISYAHLGDLLGDVTGPNMGRLPEALENYRKALDIFVALRAAEPAAATHRRQLADLYERIGRAHAAQAAATTSLTDRTVFTRQARSDDQHSLELWLDLKAHGQLSKDDVGEINKLTEEMSKLNKTSEAK